MTKFGNRSAASTFSHSPAENMQSTPSDKTMDNFIESPGLVKRTAGLNKKPDRELAVSNFGSCSLGLNHLQTISYLAVEVEQVLSVDSGVRYAPQR
jgi:hypothetical protein